ncbi:cytochrome c oxidase assembly protein [Patulibacter defluvii]|uniref:cytochrome c oxidase assembly protein n=1 Tax=Patulibacter defluvii TaxID=3095358 RepID=UPI002A7481BF|nr:cytochrome c oxidase assembly protein [Patulibacter sp. DM4]
MQWLGSDDGTLLPVLVLVAAVAAWTWRAPRDGPGGGRRLARLALPAVLLATFAGPLEWLAEERLMAAHMVQHLLLVSAIPALLFAVAPTPLLERIETAGPTRWLAGPAAAPLAAVLGVGAVWAAHVPAVLGGALENPPLTDLGHLALIAVGVVLLWPLLGPSRLTGLRALGYLAVTDLLIGVLGLWLAWYPEVVYPFYAEGPGALGIDPPNDQALAGGILLVVAEPFLAVEVVLLFFRALDDAEAADADADEA